MNKKQIKEMLLSNGDVQKVTFKQNHELVEIITNTIHDGSQDFDSQIQNLIDYMNQNLPSHYIVYRSFIIKGDYKGFISLSIRFY